MNKFKIKVSYSKIVEIEANNHFDAMNKAIYSIPDNTFSDAKAEILESTTDEQQLTQEITA